MNNKNLRITLEDKQNEFSYQKNRSNLNITFNRVAFIFFLFFVISVIYSIHLIHLGSRGIQPKIINKNILSNKLYRADIVDRNGDYIGKTISSIDIGISPSKIIDEKKLLLNLKYIFPNKDYAEVKERIKKGNFFILKKKFLRKIMKS